MLSMPTIPVIVTANSCTTSVIDVSNGEKCTNSQGGKPLVRVLESLLLQTHLLKCLYQGYLLTTTLSQTSVCLTFYPSLCIFYKFSKSLYGGYVQLVLPRTTSWHHGEVASSHQGSQRMVQRGSSKYFISCVCLKGAERHALCSFRDIKVFGSFYSMCCSRFSRYNSICYPSWSCSIVTLATLLFFFCNAFTLDSNCDIYWL